jgi:hypothetical protein
MSLLCNIEDVVRERPSAAGSAFLEDPISMFSILSSITHLA